MMFARLQEDGKRKTGWLVVLPIAACLALAAGCASNGKKEPTPKEQARKQWNNARAGVLFSLARSQFNDGHLDACRKTLNDAVALDPQNIQIHMLSARLSIEQGRLELAENELQLCRQLDPKNAEANYYSGVIFQRWQRLPTSLEFYTKACELAPAELAFPMARAEVLVMLDRRGEALTLLQDKLVYFENSPAIRDAVGQLLVQEGKYDEALPLLRQASILGPEDNTVREHLAMALYYAKQYREAISVLERLTKEQTYATRADLWVVLGECQMAIDQPHEARESYQTAAQLQPAGMDIWLGLAKAGLKLGDLARAELSIRKAIAIEGSNSEAHLLMGYLRLRQEKLDEALSCFRNASALDQKDPVSLCMCGYVLEKKGRPSEAMELYGKALKLNPDDELASTLMSQIQAQE